MTKEDKSRPFRGVLSSAEKRNNAMLRWGKSAEFLLKGQDKFLWTKHARDKMRYYRLTDSRLKRIIRHPTRTEEAILEGAVACMQLAGGKKYSEIWVMYVLIPAQNSPPF